jgi:hypothetical protein
MRKSLRTLSPSRASVALFAAYWVVACAVCSMQLVAGDLEPSGVALQLLVPIAAGGVMGFAGAPIAIGIVAGAVFGALDFVVLVTIYLRHFPGLEGLLVPTAVFGAIGAGLGLVGAFGGRVLNARRAIQR